MVTKVTILILIDGFLQCELTGVFNDCYTVTILILIDGFLQLDILECFCSSEVVTILILIDGFLQYIIGGNINLFKNASQSLF